MIRVLTALVLVVGIVLAIAGAIAGTIVVSIVGDVLVVVGLLLYYYARKVGGSPPSRAAENQSLVPSDPPESPRSENVLSPREVVGRVDEPLYWARNPITPSTNSPGFSI